MTIIETRHWTSYDVRAMCIRESLYTRGTDRDYCEMLERVSETPNPTLWDIYQVAEDINRHSVDQTVTNIMYMLSNNVVRRCYEQKG